MLLLRQHARVLPLAGLLVFIFIVAVALRLSKPDLVLLPSWRGASEQVSVPLTDNKVATGQKDEAGKAVAPGALYVEGAYNEIFSISTTDKKYFTIDFSPWEAINPNAIPHPSRKDTWVIVAQKQRSDVENSVFFSELVCNAKFKGNSLVCVDSPLLLPIGATAFDEKSCTGNDAYYGWAVGPHDARIFYGPSIPYAIYGSTAHHACLGQFILDFRILVDWSFEFFDKDQFRIPTEIERPPPYNFMEKNYFLFWDKDGQMYVHHNIAPRRVFARLSYNGTVGPDLAPAAAERDKECAAKHMPTLTPPDNTVHQATNSLLVTLCKRSDPSCEANDANTFIMAIFQQKKRFSGHLIYEPYVMLFQQIPPFAMHGVTAKPLWINGRGKQGEWKSEGKTMDQTQFFYVTSVSWKSQSQKYHGYIDDEILVLFGIEDLSTGGIDVVGGDLLKGLNIC